jgi:hypothetical protein
MNNISIEDQELNQKIATVKIQHAIDKFFEMPEYNFWSDLGQKQLRKDFIDPDGTRTKCIPYQPNHGYGSYQEQQERFKVIWNDSWDELIYDSKREERNKEIDIMMKTGMIISDEITNKLFNGS